MSSPGAEATGEGAMQAFPSPVIRYLLFPDGHVGAIIADCGVERRQGGSVEGVRGLVGLEISLESIAGSLAGHIGVFIGWSSLSSCTP